MLDESKPSKVGVVILNYNCRPTLAACVGSVLDQKYSNVEIWVVDNGSEDGSPGLVKTDFPTVELVSIGRNIGFAGLNEGIRRALSEECEYIMYVDSDAKLEPSTVSALVEYLETNPECGIVGPQQLDYRSGKAYFLGSRLDVRTLSYSPIPSADKPTECDYLGNSLIRREILRKLQFDTDFFTYFADTDLCIRAKELGYKIVGTPSARLYSMQGYTSSRVPGLRGYSFPRNRLVFMRKHTLRRFWPAALALALVDAGSRLGYHLTRREFRDAAFILVGLTGGFLFLIRGREPRVWLDLAMHGMGNRVVLA